MNRASESTVQQWGNDLAIRIPASIARSARICAGQRVEVTVAEDGIHMRPTSKPTNTLAQKLAAFDPKLHDGESMSTFAIGRELV